MRWIVAAISLIVLSGCANYVTPGRGADMSTFGVARERQTHTQIQERLNLKPLVTFPANIAVVRVQASGYSSETCRGFGNGNFSVVTARDIEPKDTPERVAKLPMVSGVAAMTQLLLPNKMETDKDIRQAAASLHADLVLIYTLDTVFTDKDFAPPLSVITLGLSPNTQARVTTTASAVLMDVRNGYVYAVAETTAKGNQLANAWTTDHAIDDARRRTETQAFTNLLTEFEQTWPKVVTQYSQISQR